MNDEAVVPAVTVKVNGASLPLAAEGDLESVTVLDDVDALSMFALSFYNFDQEKLQVTWSDSKLFSIGAQVEISLGYVGALEKVLVGEVTSLEPRFASGEPSMVTVRGYDHRHRLARGRHTRTYSAMKDSAIASQIARQAGLRAQVKDTKVKLEYVVQNNQTDLAFLRRRAGLIGYEVYVRDKTLYFEPPGLAKQAAAILQVGVNITEFAPRLSSLGQLTELTVRGWDTQKKQVVVGKAGAGNLAMMGGSSGPKQVKKAFGNAPAAGIDVAVQTKEGADQVALGRFDELALAFVEGEVRCAGDPKLRAGTVVEIQGAGKTFSGNYYVSAVTHTLQPSEGYQTSLDVRRNAA